MSLIYQNYKLAMRKYQPEDYEETIELFSNGILEHAITAIFDGINGTKPKTQIFHILICVTCLVLGTSIASPLNGIYFFMLYEAFHMTAIYLLFKAYVNNELENNMKDKNLSFWTTPPHCVWVLRAGEGMGSKLLGIVAMQKNNEKSAQLNRLSVRPDVRGIGAGKKLVMAIIKEAEKLGFQEVNLVTSDVQKAAIRLYEKIGFKKVRDIPIYDGWTYFVPQFVHGIKRIEFVYKINKN